MSLGSFSDDDEIMSEINMTPLVDVMLVLLIIFMITVPVIQHSVKLELPRAANQPNDARPPHINLSLSADGTVSWNGVKVASDQLANRMANAAAQQPQPELHLYAERQTPYERVAQVMATAQSNGIIRMGFITDPKNQP
jgi:biopolymer transport protein ExbD